MCMLDGFPLESEHMALVNVHGIYPVWMVARTDGKRSIYTQDGYHWSANPGCTMAHVDSDYVSRSMLRLQTED